MLSGCGGEKRYSGEFYGAFDTVVTVTAYCASQEEFDGLFSQTEEELLRPVSYTHLYAAGQQPGPDEMGGHRHACHGPYPGGVPFQGFRPAANGTAGNKRRISAGD